MTTPDCGASGAGHDAVTSQRYNVTLASQAHAPPCGPFGGLRRSWTETRLPEPIRPSGAAHNAVTLQRYSAATSPWRGRPAWPTVAARWARAKFDRHATSGPSSGRGADAVCCNAATLQRRTGRAGQRVGRLARSSAETRPAGPSPASGSRPQRCDVATLQSCNVVLAGQASAPSGGGSAGSGEARLLQAARLAQSIVAL